jgi:drug/metabolite transporter (DMT)-like permease
LAFIENSSQVDPFVPDGRNNDSSTGYEGEDSMPAEQASSSGMTWLIFAAMTVGSWGLYGILLHTGQIAMADPVNGRYKAFLLVGVAYLLTAVIGSMVVLWVNGADWSFPAGGLTWSLLAGTVGAIGAFGVLLAFGARGTPAVVMSIVFAGAPIVNAVVSMAVHPPAGGLSGLNWQFVLGIVLAALGGCLVTLFKPAS